MLHNKISEYATIYFPDMKISDWEYNGDRYIMNIDGFRYRIVSDSTKNISLSKRYRFCGLRISGIPDNNRDISIVDDNVDLIFEIIKELVDIDLKIGNLSKKARDIYTYYTSNECKSYCRDKKINKII